MDFWWVVGVEQASELRGWNYVVVWALSHLSGWCFFHFETEQEHCSYGSCFGHTNLVDVLFDFYQFNVVGKIWRRQIWSQGRKKENRVQKSNSTMEFVQTKDPHFISHSSSHGWWLVLFSRRWWEWRIQHDWSDQRQQWFVVFVGIKKCTRLQDYEFIWNYYYLAPWKWKKRHHFVPLSPLLTLHVTLLIL